MAVADLDADGDLDLLATSDTAGEVHWYENDGAATPAFTSRLVTDAAPGANDVTTGDVDVSRAPPAGVFYNRMSASSYTRDHRYSPELAAVVLNWLEAHGRRVANGSRGLQLEINKAAQYAALDKVGVRTPRSVVALGRESLLRAAGSFGDDPVILKPNRGGKGDGVRLFDDARALQAHIESDDYRPPVDGIAMVQQYIYAPDRSITRAEFIGGRFHYAVRVDTSDGFELCPADVCNLPAGGGAARPKFQVLPRGADVAPDQIARYERFLADNDIEVAGIEFITDSLGRTYTYDVNTNTNYNGDAEAAAGVSGMGRLADFLGVLLAEETAPPAPLRAFA